MKKVIEIILENGQFSAKSIYPPLQTANILFELAKNYIRADEKLKHETNIIGLDGKKLKVSNA